MRVLSRFFQAALLCGLAAPAAGQGTIDIGTSPFENFIVVGVDIVDSGTGGGCANFTLQRRALIGCESYVTIATIPRLTGTVFNVIVDGPLTPNTAYAYEILPCDGFVWAPDCGWGLPITALTMTAGPGVTPIGHGYLATSGAPYAYFSCGGWMCGGGNVLRLPPEAIQYVGTDIPVILYGTFIRSCQSAWYYDVTQVVASLCSVGVDAATWGSVKRLYR